MLIKERKKRKNNQKMKMKEKTAGKDEEKEKAKGKKNIIELIGSGFELWWKNPTIILPFLFYMIISLVVGAIILLVFLLTFIGSALTGLDWLQSMATFGEKANFTLNESMLKPGTETVALFALFAIIFGLVLLLARAFFFSGAIAMAQEIISGKRTGLKTMTTAGKKFLWRYFFLELIIGLGLLLWLLIFSLPALIVSNMWLLLITAASLIPLFFLFLFVYLAEYLLVLWDLKPIEAIKKSVMVVKRNYAQTLGLLVLFVLISIIVGAIPWLGELLSVLIIMPVMILAFTRFVIERGR